MCGKVTYQDYRGAMRALARLRRDQDHHERNAYRCRPCSGWHLTSQRRKTRRPRRPVSTWDDLE